MYHRLAGNFYSSASLFYTGRKPGAQTPGRFFSWSRMSPHRHWSSQPRTVNFVHTWKYPSCLGWSTWARTQMAHDSFIVVLKGAKFKVCIVARSDVCWAVDDASTVFAQKDAE